jgi:hypothetical protein
MSNVRISSAREEEREKRERERESQHNMLLRLMKHHLDKTTKKQLCTQTNI